MLKHTIIGLVLLALLSACSGARHPAVPAPDAPNEMKHARLLEIRHGQGYTHVVVRMPGDSMPLASYTLVKEGLPDYCVEGSVMVRTPLRRSIVFSSVHADAICSVGGSDAVAGVADAKYFTAADAMSEAIARNKVADVGSSLAPDLERIISLSPDAVLLSPYEDLPATGLEKSGVPLIYLADYLEDTPLARMEWIKLIGELFGREAIADSIASEGERNYISLRDSIAGNQGTKPKVFSELPYSGVWYVPGGRSYAARMFADAGADYPWASENLSGSIPLDVAGVIDRASSAQIWLIKYAGSLSEESLRAMVPHIDAFEAWPGGVYVSDTKESDLYYALAFRPDLVLADYARILHPGMFADGAKLRYFKKLTE